MLLPKISAIVSIIELVQKADDIAEEIQKIDDVIDEIDQAVDFEALIAIVKRYKPFIGNLDDLADKIFDAVKDVLKKVLRK